MKFVTFGFVVLAFWSLPQVAWPHESAIDQAALLGRALEGVTCRVPGDEPQHCDLFGERLLKNKALLAAFEYARKKEVDIIISTRFRRSSGYVIIDVKATDDRIVKFLVGSRKLSK